MLVDGKHICVVKWIHGDLCVVRVEVDAVVPSFDPQEAYLEPTVVKFLDHLQQLANTGQTDELARHGNVYVRKTA
jgi:hypothetical protein